MFTVEHYYGIHQGGTKDYHLYYISVAGEGHGLLVKTWGKIGASGTSMCELTTSQGLSKELANRRSRGYDMRLSDHIPSNSVSTIKCRFSNLKAALEMIPTVHRRSISNAQLATLDPENYSLGDKSPYLSSDIQDAEVENTKALQKAIAEKEKSEADQVLKSNPMFGMF